jgi:hypothetical protein
MLNSRASNVPQPKYSPAARSTDFRQQPVYTPRTFANNVRVSAAEASDPDLGTDSAFMPAPSRLDVAERRLEQLASNMYDVAQQRVQPPLVPEQCSDSCLPAVLETQWQEQFIGCPVAQVTRECRMYRKDPRLWQADLNEARYERGIAIDAEWDMYKHHNARQSWIQFLSTDFQSRKDNWMRPINSFEDAYCVKADVRYGKDNREYPVSCNTRPVSDQSM